MSTMNKQEIIGDRFTMSGLVQHLKGMEGLETELRRVVENADADTVRRWAVQRNCQAGTAALDDGEQVNFIATAYLSAGGNTPQIWIDAVTYDEDGKLKPVAGARFSWKRSDDAEAARIQAYLAAEMAAAEGPAGH